MSLFSELGDTAPALPDRGVLESTPGTAGQFGPGLRSGGYSAGSQLNAAAAAVADRVGLRDFASQRYDAADALAAEAAASAPRVTSFRDVRNLRDAFDYGTGLLGQSAPASAAALGAGLATGGAGVIPAALAAGAAQVPLEVGDVVQRQRAAGDGQVDLGEALLAGGGSAALQGGVPGVAAAKVLGTAGKTAARGTLAARTAKNLAAVPGEALAEGGGEVVKQLGSGKTLANLDTEAVLENAVGGAVAGAPFAAVGAAGDALPRAGASADPSRAPIQLDDAGKPVAAPSGPSTAVPKDLFDGAKDAVDDTVDRIAKGNPLGDLKEFASAQGDRLTAMVSESDRAKFEKVKSYADELASDAGLTPERREQLAAATRDLGDEANQRIVAGLKQAKDLGARAAETVQGLFDSVSKKLGEPEGDAKRSESLPDGLRKTINDVVAPVLRERNPELLNNPDAINKLGDGLRKVLQVAARDGQVDETTLGYLQRVFGEDTRTVLEELHGTVAGSKDKAATERFFGALNDIADNEARSKTEREIVQENLSPEFKDTVTPAQLDAAVANIRAFVSEEVTKNTSRAEREYRMRQFREQLGAKFGKKADVVLAAFQDNAAKKTEVIDDRGELTDGEARDVADEKEPTQYYGGGKDKAKPELLLHPNEHRQRFGNESQAERLLQQAKSENPDRNVRFVKAADYAKEVGMTDEQLRIATRGEPDKYGMVVAEGTKQEGRITAPEFERMKLDTSKTSHLKSSSRIDTGVKGVTLDALRMTKAMNNEAKLPYIESDDISTAHRTARAFLEAVGAAQDHLGKAFQIPDSTVIAYQNGKALTYGEAKQLKFANPKGEDFTGKLKELRKAYREAKSFSEKKDIMRRAEALIGRRDREIAGEYDDKTDPVKDYLEAAGKRGASKDDQIHIAASQIESGELRNRTNLDGTARDTTPPKRDIKTSLRDLASELRASSVAAQRALGEKLSRLIGTSADMKPADFDRLTELLALKRAGERAEIINSLAAKYGAPRPKAEAAAQAALVEKAKAGNADAAYNLQRTASQNTSTSSVRADVEAHIEKVLAKSVEVEWAKLPFAGEFTTQNAKDVIRLSVHSLDPMSTAFHESMHAFIKQLRTGVVHETANTLFKAADRAEVQAQLRELLKGEPAALKQLANAEERVAYMYQFWAQGQLKLAPAPTSVLGKIKAFIQKALGIWSNDERALHIMEYFQSGQYAADMTPGAVARATLEPGRNAALEKAKTMTEPLARLADTVGSMGSARLRDTGVPALRELADLIKAEGTAEKTDAGFIPTARAERNHVLNDLGTRLKPYTKVQINEALEALQSKTTAAGPEARLAAREVRRTLDRMFDYMKEAGVKVNDLGYGADYFPRVYDADYISRHQPEFRTLLEKHGVKDPAGVMSKLMTSDGNEFRVETLKPGMQHLKERRLSMIPDAELAPFMQKDLFEVVNSYVTQATRRAEWARRFNDDGSKVVELLAKAKREGATPRDVATAEDYIRGVDGTLGDDINPTTRRLFGNVLVYQNVRLLPLAIFSSIVDPMGVVVRGGTVGDAWSAFSRGMKETVKNFQKSPDKDAATELAETMGVIENASLTHSIGALYSQGMVGDTARKINDTFFRYNLMEQWNRSVRVGATEAALRFIGKHADGRSSAHSARWTRELGLEPGDVKMINGRVATTEAEGLTPEQVGKVRAAVNKWVDGAVLRPDAADKPIWMNDPHWALVAHLKQFVYSFHQTILKRVAHEYSNGNYAPAMALASYVPIMIAADLVKGLVQGGGEQPEWKRGWTAGDYVWSGVQRAGLLGVGQFAADGVGSLAGPTIEQLGKAAAVAGGQGELGSFVLKSLPANALYGSLASSSDAPADTRP